MHEFCKNNGTKTQQKHQIYNKNKNKKTKEGEIVPVEITVGLIKKAMQKAMDKENKFLFCIDGFPRNFDNFEGWNRVMGNFAEVPFLLLINATEDEMTKRILSRAQQSGPNQRIDDNEEAIRKRLRVFGESTKPVLNTFQKMGKCKEVNGMQPVDKVYSEVRNLFYPFVQSVQRKHAKQ